MKNFRIAPSIISIVFGLQFLISLFTSFFQLRIYVLFLLFQQFSLEIHHEYLIKPKVTLQLPGNQSKSLKTVQILTLIFLLKILMNQKIFFYANTFPIKNDCAPTLCQTVFWALRVQISLFEFTHFILHHPFWCSHLLSGVIFLLLKV